MSITFTSHVKHRLGVWLVGTPDSMEVPKDFYFDPCDRTKPTNETISEPKVGLSRLATDWFRIEHRHRVAMLTGVLWTVLIVVLLVPFGLYAAGHSAYVKHEAKVAAAQAIEDQQIQSRCNQETLDQQKSDSACVDLAARQLAARKADQKAYWEKQCAAMPDENRARSPYCNGQLPEIK